MPNNPYFSIITVCLNSEKTLARTIDSIRNQTFRAVEYIVIDGGSTDSTLSIINDNKDIIDIFHSGKDQGIYDAMNKGINLSTGDIGGILNSDDFYDNDQVLNDVCKKFTETNADIVYGDIVYFSKDINKITRKWSPGKYSEKLLNSGWTIPHPALFVKKEIYNKYD
jgi:glycosyltransferase